MRGSANGEGTILPNPLRMAEIDERDSPLCTYHEIGGLYISIDELVRMQILKDEAHLHDDQPSEALVEFAGHLE